MAVTRVCALRARAPPVSEGTQGGLAKGGSALLCVYSPINVSSLAPRLSLPGGLAHSRSTMKYDYDDYDGDDDDDHDHDHDYYYYYYV